MPPVMRRPGRLPEAEEPAGVAGIQPGQRQEQQKVRRVEALVPGGLAADEGAESEVPADESRRLVSRLARPAPDGKGAVGKDAPGCRAEVFLAQAAADGRGGIVTRSQSAARAVWDAGAELVGEHAVTQPLAFLDLAVARREARAELGGADQAAVAASSAPWLGMLHTPPYRHAGWRPRREAVNGA